MKQFSSFETEVRPGVPMTVISFSYSSQVLPSLVFKIAKRVATVFDWDKDFDF